MNITKLPEIKNLKLKTNSALFWGEDCEDVKIFENISRNEFDKIADQFGDYCLIILVIMLMRCLIFFLVWMKSVFMIQLRITIRSGDI